MKIRNGYVSNSSSSSFIIKNISNESKTIIDFAKETSYLCEMFCDEYGYNNESYNEKEYIKDAINRQLNKWGFSLPPNESVEYAFGDEDGDVIGTVCDYMMRIGGKTDSFSWRFFESLR